MSRPAGRQVRSSCTCVLAIAALIAVAPASAQAAGAAHGWTRWVDVDLSARVLGLPAGAPAERLARAALGREARRLGIGRSASRVWLAHDRATPARHGARALRHLRFRQTAGGLPVVWSQIDVTVAAGRVRSIAATVVPVERGPVAGELRVSRARALRIARLVVPGAEEAFRPLAVAYAGAPSTDRAATARAARRAWVVEVQRDDAADDLCIVVDAETGKVIARWQGMADRPDRGPDSRRAGTVESRARAAQGGPLDPHPTLLSIFDDADDGTLYATFRTNGDPHPAGNWPTYLQARVAPLDVTLNALTANAANVAWTICAGRDFCGARRGLVPLPCSPCPSNPPPPTMTYVPWKVYGNISNTDAHASMSLRVEIATGHIMMGNGNPNAPFNDVIAHEFGHIRDWIYAGDRSGSQNVEGNSVEEALADMFAYDYDRGDATEGEETGSVFRNWQNPGAVLRADNGNKPYPAHMNDYDADADPHFNSTILSHAYFLFVQRVGHDQAGHVLTTVPQRLSPRPTFHEVRRGFVDSSAQLYGRTVADHAAAAFSAVGLAPPPPDPDDPPDCGPHEC